MSPTMLVAACHTPPHFLSATKTTSKAISLIHTASQKNGASLVVFPEAFIPGFPIWLALRSPAENHALFSGYVAESIYVDGPEVNSLRQTAKECSVVVSIGFSEKVRYSSATLFNSNVIIGTDGEIVVHHRKLMPTFFEKLIWAPGDGAGLRVAETEGAKVGMLICGENTNPLARYSLMALGEQVHISSWPPIWPTRMLGQNVSDGRGGGGSGEGKDIARKNYDNVAANRTRAAAHCFEAKCFGILCSGMIDADVIRMASEGAKDEDGVKLALELSPRGATMFLDPTGALLPGYTVGVDGSKTDRDFLQEEEGILYAKLDMDECVEGKQYHDVVGGYQRLDVFNLKVDRTRRKPITFVENDP